ncbi:HepT-like ribonuclease domain-containing protein [Sulfuritalea sp.]|uniref:HepT-like ribonuclease domain-containing protein n=1 Tax=Sulfuritalea sp. TaxID=2480090 RepID=UPI001ACF8987|nr:HepT-like ribonuclease domain-containing protein [Sulfuritalea sp.]MBN8476198.1 DUF86 domain-containing protein [Sulfuritalea sp.]
MKDKARRIPERLQDMREAIANARDDLGALTKEEFLADGKTQRAVLESLIVIGEAANRVMRLDPVLAQRNPDAWQQFRDAYDMRIVLTHEYFRVDAAVVWETVKNDLPQLNALVESLLG